VRLATNNWYVIYIYIVSNACTAATTTHIFLYRFKHFTLIFNKIPVNVTLCFPSMQQVQGTACGNLQRRLTKT
jgi:hypothetical protein